ncbi:Amidase signature domain protein [Metarhizium brunneum]
MVLGSSRLIGKDATNTTTAASSTAASKSTTIFEAGGARYIAIDALAFEPSVDIPLEPSLVTVVCNRNDVPLNKGWLRAYLDGLDKCDVFDRKLFLAGIIITTPPSRADHSTRLSRVLERVW